jgi:hypothetical protein
MKLKLKRSLGSTESINVYRITQDFTLKTKIDSSIEQDELNFNINQIAGAYVFEIQKNK